MYAIRSYYGIVRYAEQLVHKSASASNLRAEIAYMEIFQATVNSTAAVGLVRSAVGENALQITDNPFQWSEDFGQITAISA